MQFDLKLFSGDIEIMTLSFPITIFPRKPVNVVRSAFDRISPTRSLTRRVLYSLSSTCTARTWSKHGNLLVPLVSQLPISILQSTYCQYSTTSNQPTTESNLLSLTDNPLLLAR
mgnify:CR=1 FL=1